MLPLTLSFSPFQRSELGPQAQKGNIFLLQNIIKYCSFRRIKFKFPCLSMLHVKTVCLLRPQLLQEEREVTPGFAHSAACPSPPLAASRLCPWQPTAWHNPQSLQEWGLLCPLCHEGDGGCLHKAAWRYSQNPDITGFNGKCATDPHKAKSHPLLRLWSVNSLDLFPAPQWYLQAAGTWTYAVSCVAQTARLCTVFSKQFPEAEWYFKVLFHVQKYLTIKSDFTFITHMLFHYIGQW